MACAILVACCASRPSALGRTDGSTEYPVKAAFLLNFAQFIKWPPGAFASADQPIAVGVLGQDPFGSLLEQTFQDELIEGRKLVVERSSQLEELKSCHIIFVSKSEVDKAVEIIASLGNRSVATVGEVADFAHRGGVINFYIDNNKVRFEINPDAAKERDLKISSQLLKRARIVNADAGGKARD